MTTSRIVDIEKVHASPDTDAEEHIDESESNLVDFDGPQDPINPLNWSATYKWSVVILISVMSLVV